MTTSSAEVSKTATKVAKKTGTKASAKPSPAASAKKRTPARTRDAKARTAAMKRPVTLEGARREMLRLVCVNSAAITQAMIGDALQGKYLSAKFLFDAAGLCAGKGEDLDDATQRETLASFLLTHWQEPAQEGQATEGQIQNGQAPEAQAAQVTEVAEVTPDLAGQSKAPVEL